MELRGKKLLFVTWDSDQSNYLESLFFPILKGLGERGQVEAHVMQFSWAGPQEVGRIKALADSMGIGYVQHPIHRKPTGGLGALWTVYQGVRYIKDYIQGHGIQVLMPRSTMPAMMVNRLWEWLKRVNVEVVFDADGLPLEERVDFSGLRTETFQYRMLKSEETKILKRADWVLCRSEASINIHLRNIGEYHRAKFTRVTNGRDSEMFRPDPVVRAKVRKDLSLGEGDMLWVYTGSLGTPYELGRMLALFEGYHSSHPGSKFLLLTRQASYLAGRIPKTLEPAVIVREGGFKDVPSYLSAGDLGLSLRKFAPSLAGLAPIKLGEYLLMGLPVIASPGVGDTEKLLEGKDFAFVLKDNGDAACLEWIEGLRRVDRVGIRQFGLNHFSLENAVAQYLRENMDI